MSINANNKPLMTDAPTKPAVYIALDTEFENEAMYEENIIQLGFVVFTHDADTADPQITIVDTQSFCFTNAGKRPNPHCMSFWAEFSDIHARIRAEAAPIDVQFTRIQTWLRGVYDKYTVVNYVADIACVDFAWFKNLYLRWCDATSDPYTLPYKCISTDNMKTALVYSGITTAEYIKEKLTACPYPHTHYASEDAAQTAYEFALLMRVATHNLK